MADNIERELERIAAQFVEATQQTHGSLPFLPYDEEWRSPCATASEDKQWFMWQPTTRQTRVDFSGLEHALELTFPSAMARYYSCFWSASIPVAWGDRSFELLQLWNEEDEENLMHNFLGHCFEKKRVRQAPTLFFALVDDERFLSCDVATGAIFLEELGGLKPTEVAPDLLSLLSELEGVAFQPAPVEE